MGIWEQLYSFQREAVEFIFSRPGAGILAEQGTGKTYIAAGAIERLMEHHENFEGLCIVPLANLQTTWLKTLAKIEDLTVWTSWEPYRQASGPKLLVLNYEALRGKSFVKKIVKRHWTIVVYDESQRIKAKGSKASRAAARFSDVDHRVALTGTPIDDAPQDLWAQLRFFAPEAFGTKWAAFESRWLRPSGFMGYELKFKWNLLPKFLERVAPHVMRLTKAEVLDLPPLTFHRELVPLLGEQRRIHDEIDEHMTSTVAGREIICDLAITQLVRLQQVVGGFVRVDGDSLPVGRAKQRRLATVLRRSLSPVVIFCKYKEEIDLCVEAAKTAGFDRVGIIRGEKGKRKKRPAIVEAFQRGEIDALVCQIRAGGVGLDLFRACEGIFYSCTFSHIDFHQAVSRLHRNGQTRPVKITILQAANTVDGEIWSALLMKQTVTEKVLDSHRRKTKWRK